MKKLGVLIIFLLLFLTVGCAVPQYSNVPTADVTATPPDIVQKIPLNVAILITDQMESYSVDSLPLGQMIKKNAFDILSTAFNKAVCNYSVKLFYVL
jgi:hypothetical protein